MEQEYVQEAKAVAVARPMSRKPTKIFRQGACSACIFFNEVMRDGRRIERAKVSFARLYRKDGRWKVTRSLNREDLPAAILVLGQAYEWLEQFEVESSGRRGSMEREQDAALYEPEWGDFDE